MSLDKIINNLQAYEGSIAFTITIPTVKVGDYDKNRIRWKNAISDLKAKCDGMDISCSDIVAHMETKTKDSDFWANQGGGLAYYYSKESQELVKLNHEVIPMVDIGSTFNTYPLISEKQANSTAYVLCLSKNEIKLYLISNGSISEIDISDNVVNNYDEAFNFDEASKSLQHHSVGGDTYFHGNGAEEDNDGIRIEQYIRRVDDGLMEVIQGTEIPLILASVEEYHPIYQKVTNYKHLQEDVIAGNPDRYNTDEILDKVNCMMTEMLGANVSKFLDNYNNEASRDLLFETIDELRNGIVTNNVDKLLVNEAQIANMDADQKTRITRDLAEAYRLGANMLCINDSESNHIVMGIKRFKMETSEN